MITKYKLFERYEMYPFRIILYNDIGFDLIPILYFKNYDHDYYDVVEGDETEEYCKVLEENEFSSSYTPIKLILLIEDIMERYTNVDVSENYETLVSGVLINYRDWFTKNEPKLYRKLKRRIDKNKKIKDFNL